jgi:hypothetical protein
MMICNVDVNVNVSSAQDPRALANFVPKLADVNYELSLFFSPFEGGIAAPLVSPSPVAD